MNTKNKALVILSGGQDSTTCLHWALARFDEVRTVTYYYGQRHAREIEAARIVARMAQVPNEAITLGPVLRSTSPLVSDNELEQYADHNSLPGGIEKTFVPFRNALFLTLAANYALSFGATTIITGVSAEDFGGYPDCRYPFISAMGHALSEAVAQRITIETPLLHMTKRETVELAFSMPQCWMALAYTHTSYDGAYPPTGKDHATLLREKGFLEAMLPDPLVLRAVSEGLMPLPTTANYSGEVLPPMFFDKAP